MAAAVVGCARNRPHRTFAAFGPDVSASAPPACERLASNPVACDLTGTGSDPGAGATCTSIDALEDQSVAGIGQRRNAACYTTEVHPPSDDTGLPHTGFDLHVVEFDDQGRAWDGAAIARTIDRLVTRVRTDRVLAVTFVHGWKHNGQVCDDNIACFRDVLEILSKAETYFAAQLNAALTAASRESMVPVPEVRPRRVVGIAVTWRGRTLKPEPFASVTSFWGRKHTAHVVGDNGAVTSLIEGIRATVSQGRPGSTAVFVGHSFGGALLLSAMATTLNGSVRKALVESPQRPLIELRGDLFVLVNPAVESARYESLFAEIRDAPEFDTRQLPVMLTLASEGDSAVKIAFPVGQLVSTWQRSARDRRQWQSLLQGAGHYKPFYTHVLRARTEGAPPVEPRPASACACSSGLRRYGDALLGRMEPLYRRVIADALASAARRALATRVESLLPGVTGRAFAELTGVGVAAIAARPTPPGVELPDGLASFREFLYSTLQPVRPVDPNRPFLTVNVDDDVVGSHGDIFNHRFLNFLMEYTVLMERKRETFATALLTQ